MFRKFNDLSIALKLNLLLGAMVFAVISIATLWVSSTIREKMEEKAMVDLEKTNAMVVSMFEAYNRSLTNDIERTGQLFSAAFDGKIELQGSGEAAKLLLDGKPFDELTDRLDAFSTRSGTVATVFVRQGDNFTRTATSVKKEDGSRVTGTALAAEHPARALLLAGNSYTGKATLFGKDYITHYGPVKDTAGKIVGAFFVGFDLTTGLQALKKEILSIKIGETGYIFAVDAGPEKGMATVHPSLEGKSVLAAKDSNGKEFILELIEKKSGVIRYDWANKDEKFPRKKIVVFSHFAPWNWVIASGSYVDEFTRLVDSLISSIVVMAIAILAAIGILCHFLTRHWVSKPLRDVMAETAKIADGDLTVVMHAGSNDELGRMKQSVGKMAESLKKAIGDSLRASGIMLDHSLRLVTAAEQVARGSQAQSDSASEMAASIEEMSTSISQVAQHARDAQGISSRSGETAVQGGVVIKQATGSMVKISDTVREASMSITDLGKLSQEISAVVQVIREIADQTNLLALNAAIEAARAGEQGRGFAVVADEVRKLAERTTTSTHSIRQMIDDIQASTERAIGRMNEGVAQVEEGSVLANQAGIAIEDIHHGSRNVIDAVQSISNALDEQSTATQNIAKGVEGIAQNADLNHSASIISAESAQKLREMAMALDKELSYFRVA